MDARATLLIGGGAAVAVTVAVASVIGITSAVALADRPGTPMADAAIVVPGQTAATPAPPSAASAPVTVPAPAAQEIATTPKNTVAAPRTGTGSTGASSDRTSGSDDATSGRTGQSGDSTAKNGSTAKHEPPKSPPAKGQGSGGQDSGGQGSGDGDSQGGDVHNAVRDIQMWTSDLSVQWDRLRSQIVDSVQKTDMTSVQVHPRTWIGWQEQSSRSPDSGD